LRNQDVDTEFVFKQQRRRADVKNRLGEIWSGGKKME